MSVNVTDIPKAVTSCQSHNIYNLLSPIYNEIAGTLQVRVNVIPKKLATPPPQILPSEVPLFMQIMINRVPPKSPPPPKKK